MFTVLLLVLIFTGADDNEDSEGDDLVPYGLGSNRGWLPSDRVQWALVQPHPFKNQEAKLDLKLQLAVKESAALKPEDLDKLRTETTAALDAESSPVGE